MAKPEKMLDQIVPRDAYTRIMGYLTHACARRTALRQECVRIDESLQSNTVARSISGGANYNMPLTRGLRRATRGRLSKVLFGQTPHVRLRNTKGEDTTTGIDWNDASRACTEWYEFAHKRREELNAKDVTKAAIMEIADYGLGGVKIIPIKEPTYQGPRWFFVSIKDILFPEGMGQDLQKFSYFGSVVYSDEAAVRAAMDAGDWDKKAAARVLTGQCDPAVVAEVQELLVNFPEIQTAQMAEVNSYIFAELWCREPDGKDYEVVVHIPTGTIVRYTPTKLTKRPFFFARFDERTSVSFLGTGVVHDCVPSQGVVNDIYNNTIDAMSVALRSARLIRSDSLLAETIGSGDSQLEISPAFQAITENPEADLRVVALGDASQIGNSIGLVDNAKSYALDLLGLQAANMGNVSVTRRAPASGVMQVMAEGSIPITEAAQRLATMYQEAVLFTFDLYRSYFSDTDRLYQVLGEDGNYLEQVFSIADKVSHALVVEVDVADPNKSADAVVQQSLLRAQFLGQFIDKLANMVMIMSQPTLPQGARNAFTVLADKYEEVVRRALEASDDVQDVENLLPGASELLKQVQPAQPMMQPGMQPPPDGRDTPPGPGSNAPPLPEGDGQ